VRSIKEDYLDRMILFGEQGLRTALRDFVEHYYSDRNPSGARQSIDFDRSERQSIGRGCATSSSVVEDFSITTIGPPDPGEAIS
jgi:hypothetical protein